MSRVALGLERFNALPSGAAYALLLDCCHAPRWAGAVTAGRPYADPAGLFAAADAAWAGLDPAQWRAAFAAHPAIGETSGGSAPELSRGEQAGLAGADEATRRELAAGNRAYRDRFGYVFLIRASGRSAGELLTELRRRLGNDPDAELAEAAEQQRQIAQLRLTHVVVGYRTG